MGILDLNSVKKFLVNANPLNTGAKDLSVPIEPTARLNWSLLFSGRTNFDYAKEVGDGSKNSIVVSVVTWITRTFPEAPLRVYQRQTDGTERIIADHPLAELLEHPNSWYSGPYLWMATLTDWLVNGNAYWLKARNEVGEVVELYYLPHYLVEPAWDKGTTQFIKHYEYDQGAGKPKKEIDPKDIVHFRYMIDPDNIRKGRSPLYSVLREIFSDNEATNMSASLLRNLGMPGVIITPEEETEIGKPEAQAIKEEYEQRFTGDNRGRPMILNSRIKVVPLSFTPEQMNLKDMHRVPEERVTAVFGLPAVVVGLGAGIEHSTYNNMAEAREAAYENNIIPTQRLLAAEIQSQLLPDFTPPNSRRRHLVKFDLSQVRVLQKDMDAVYERATKAAERTVITVAAAKREMGIPTSEEDEYYIGHSRTVFIPAQILREATNSGQIVLLGEGVVTEPKDGEEEETIASTPGGSPTTTLPPGFQRLQVRKSLRQGMKDASNITDNDKTYATTILSLVKFLQPYFEEELKTYFDEMQRRLEEKVSKIESADTVFSGHDVIHAPYEKRAIRKVLRTNFRKLFSVLMVELSEVYGNLPDDEHEALLGEALEKASQYSDSIVEVSVRALTNTIDTAYENKVSLSKDLFSPLFEQWKSRRASTIAKTELIRWAGEIQLLRFRKADNVVAIRLVDSSGDSSCETCAQKHGALLSLDDYEEELSLEHPNGSLIGVPVLAK